VVVAEDVQERSDKENDHHTEEIVSRVVERAVSHRDKPQRRRNKQSKSDHSRHSDNADDTPRNRSDSIAFRDAAAVTAAIESRVVISPTPAAQTADHDLPDSARPTQPPTASHHSATSSKQPRRARARIIVPATEVVPRKKSTKTSIKIVVASDVETSPQHKIGCFSGASEQFGSMKDAFHSIPVVRDTSNAEYSTDPNASTAGAALDAGPKQQSMTVVVASDVEVSPTHQNLGCVSAAVSTPKMDVVHSVSRPNQSTIKESSTRKQTRSSSNKKRDVPIVMNGQIVGSSAAWSAPHAHPARPTPETPSRSARRTDSAPLKPTATVSAPVEATSVPDAAMQPIASVAPAPT
jgi:hypothetical protein